jgi:DNA polymerase-3 subunit alpha
MLNIHSKFSLRYGIKAVEWIIDWSISAGYTSIALTDINNTSAALSFIQQAQLHDFNPVMGVDIRNGLEQQYIILARNNRGFHEMNRFLSLHLHQGISFGAIPDFLPNCFIIYPFGKAPAYLRDNEFVGIHPKQVSQLRIRPIQHTDKFVALQSMTFENKRDFNAHRLLRSIDENCLLSKLSPSSQGSVEECFLPYDTFKNQYSEFPEIFDQTEALLKSCAIHFAMGENAGSQNLQTYTGNKHEDRQLVEQLCQKGMKQRYPVLTKAVKERVEREIQVIEEKGYLAYFLVTWDIVNYANSRGYFHVGRGSGANSIVAYLLGITDVDPLELDLYFERFMNVYRKNPPDFDIDFAWTERDDVTRYIFERFEHTALLCTYNTFQFRATLRELGKVFGLPKHEIDALTAGKRLTGELDELGHLIVKYSRYIEGLPSYLSVHAGGIIISEKPLSWFTATFLPPKGFPTTQFSMLEAEDVGLYKYDILSQRGLSKIHDCIKIVNYNQPNNAPRDIRDLHYFKTDERIRNLLKTGNAMGCFYVESPAMRMLMKKLEVQNYLELVAASSIIRPGVSSSGMMREYILRHKDPERRKTAHPTLLEIMPETYGVMVYQEDVIKVAHYFAGLTLDEADILRRGMSGKYRSREEFQAIRHKFFDNCIQKGYTAELTEAIWRQIESFAGYAFSKGHSASYAVESFQSLYLKAYYPLEYMVATINNFGGYYRTEIYIHEARRLGATIEAPDINLSSWESIIKGNTIYLGFNLIDGIESKTIHALLNARQRVNTFTDVDHFFKEVTISLEQVVLLARISAFRQLNPEKKNLLWRIHLYYSKEQKPSIQSILFENTTKKYTLPQLETDQFEQAFEEMELLGFPLCSPFEILQESIRAHVYASELVHHQKQHVLCYGYLISVKKTRTARGDTMLFGHFYDVKGELLDTVHFPDSAKRFPFHGIGVYELKGIVSEEFGYFTLEVVFMRKMSYIPDVRYEESRENKKAAS